MKKTITNVFLILMLGITISMHAQEKTVKGVITDAEDNTPLIGATISIKGEAKGVTSDFEGNFNIVVNENNILIISYVGYITQEIPVLGNTTINVTLQQESNALDEVVVIGYGTKSRREIISAISSISSDKIAEVPVTNIANAVQGKIAGVRVYHSTGGQPGSNSTFRIRGGSSINRSNDPLFIVDGMQKTLNDINPNDVSSVEVLKDASATAIYGSRASNGVVIITTKKGKTGKAEINFSSTFGFAEPSVKMDFVDATTFLEYARPAYQRSNRSNLLTATHGVGTGNDANSPWSTSILQPGQAVPEGYLSMPDPINPSNTLIYQDNDFQDIAFQNALEKEYFISAIGGSDKIKYYAGLGWTDIEGIARSTEYQRFTARSNIDFKLSDKLELQTKFNISRTKTDDFDRQRNIFGRSIWLLPTARVYFDDGSFGTGNNETYTNPLFYNDVRQAKDYVYRTNVGASLIWKPIEGLSFQLKGDYFNQNSTSESFKKANIYDATRPATFDYGLRTDWQVEAIGNYSKTLNEKHNFGLLIGVSSLNIEHLDASAAAFGGPTDNIQTLNASPEKTEASTSRSDEVLNGIFSRFSYDFDGKYLMSASLRRDGSSRLAEDQRIGYFPSFSMGWIMSEEKFFENVSILNFVKLRGSWGQTGNNDVSTTAAAGLYSVGNNYNFQAGSFPTVIPNENLAWETTTQWDIGTDLSFLNNKIRLIADVYNKTTDNLIFTTPLPNTSGFSSITKNIGKVQFTGVEFELSTINIQNDNFSWESDFNIGFNKNKVLELPDNDRENNRIGGFIDTDTGEGIGGIAEGESLFSIIGYKNDFIIDTQAQADNAHHDTQARGYSAIDGQSIRGRKFPGDYEWVDKNGDGIIDSKDQFVLGNNVPHTTGGLSNTLKYKGLEFNIFMDFALGHSINDQIIRRGDANAIGGAARPTTNILRSWQQEGDIASGKANFPRFDYHDATQQRNIHRGSSPVSASVYDASFLSLREVKLGYNIPEKILDYIGFNSVKIYLAGQNLHYFTKYPGFNPEYSTGSSYDDNTYPLARKIVLGINVGF